MSTQKHGNNNGSTDQRQAHTNGARTAARKPATKFTSRLKITNGGLIRMDSDEDGNEVEHWVSPTIFVDARTHDSSGAGYGQLVRFNNEDGRERVCILNYSELIRDGKAAIERLFDLGFKASDSRKDLDSLRQYILHSDPKVTICSVPSHGWHDGIFIHDDQYDLAEQGPGEIVIVDPGVAAGHRYNVSGNLEDWKENVSRLCEGNTRLVLPISAAFAAPLLYMLKAPNIGLHLRGISSIGKTSALYAAGSVWGGGGETNNSGFVQSWRATANGLELQCAIHNDAPLCLDEISLVNEKELGDIVYCLGNGIGKRRATRDIKSRPVIQFRLVFLSCGEWSLHDLMQGVGKRTKGGQESRLIDVPADPGHGYGLYETLHGHVDGASLSQCLTQAAKTYYGSASKTFTDYLVDNFEGVVYEAKRLRDRFVEKLKLKENQAAGEVYRVAESLGLIAAAGEIATSIGITGWEHEQEAADAARQIFDAWRHERGDTYGSYDVHAGMEALSTFLFRYSSRFQKLNPKPEEHQYPIHDRAGLFEEDPENDCRRYYIDPDVFRNEICRGYDAMLILKELQIHHHLVYDSTENRLTIRKSAPGEGQSRFYCVKSTVCQKS